MDKIKMTKDGGLKIVDNAETKKLLEKQGWVAEKAPKASKKKDK